MAVFIGAISNKMTIAKIESQIKGLESALKRNKDMMKKYPYKTEFWKSYFSENNQKIKNHIKILKKQRTILK